jgi:hypothetical protein
MAINKETKLNRIKEIKDENERVLIQETANKIIPLLDKFSYEQIKLILKRVKNDIRFLTPILTLKP